MKKMHSTILSIILVCSVLFTMASAAYPQFDDRVKHLYLFEDFYDSVWNGFNNYFRDDSALWNYTTNRKYHAYTLFVDNINEDSFLYAAVQLVSANQLTDEALTADRYTEILINMLTLMDHELQHVFNHQSEADCLKTIPDYILDVAGMVANAATLGKAGGLANATVANLRSFIEKHGFDIAELTIDGIGKVIDNNEAYRLMQKTLNSYERYDVILSAIIKRSTNKPLVSAATTLKYALKKALAIKLNFAAKSTIDAAVFLGDTFFDKVVLDLLKDPKTWSSADKKYAGYFAKIDAAKKGLDALALSRDLAVFACDMLIGVSDMMNRVNEMRALSEIFDVLVAEVKDCRAKATRDDFDTIDNVYNMMRWLTYINARGEYCTYRMVMYDSQLLSLLFRDKDSTEEWYSKVKGMHRETANTLDLFYPSPLDYLAGEHVSAQITQDYSSYIGYYSSNWKADRATNPENAATYGVEIIGISDGEITFEIEHCGLAWSPLTGSDIITANLIGNRADFNWTAPAWEQSGTGTLRLENGNVIINVSDDNYARGSLATNGDLTLTKDPNSGTSAPSTPTPSSFVSAYEIYESVRRDMRGVQSGEIAFDFIADGKNAGKITISGSVKQVIHSPNNIDYWIEVDISGMGMDTSMTAYYRNGYTYYNMSGQKFKVKTSVLEMVEQASSVLEVIEFPASAVKNSSVSSSGGDVTLQFEISKWDFRDPLKIVPNESILDSLNVNESVNYSMVIGNDSMMKEASLKGEYMAHIMGEAVTIEFEYVVNVISVNNTSIDFPDGLDSYPDFASVLFPDNLDSYMDT